MVGREALETSRDKKQGSAGRSVFKTRVCLFVLFSWEREQMFICY